MPVAQVTFASHEPKIINGANGQFTVHKFKTPDGTLYETTQADAANAAYAFAFNADGSPTNTLLAVTYEVKQNGQYTNNRFTAVTTASAGAMAPGVTPSGAPTAPATQVATPAGQAPAVPAGDFNRQTHPGDAQRMTRSVSHQSGLEALSLALKAHELGVAEIKDPASWLMTADWIVTKALELSGDIGSYIFHGSRPSLAAAAPISSGAVGDGTAGVVAQTGAAPAAAMAASAVQVTADDDIPF